MRRDVLLAWAVAALVAAETGCCPARRLARQVSGFHSSAGGLDQTAFAWSVADGAFRFSFTVRDDTPFAHPQIKAKRDLEDGDRVEVFFSSRADLSDWYYAAEIDPYGNVLDYRVKHYRRFDYGWSFKTLKVRTKRQDAGYSVAGAISVSELAALGIDLKGFHLGAFRADFKTGGELVAWSAALPLGPGEPDFHVPRMLAPAAAEGL